MPPNDELPPAWEVEATSRERLARIETKVDMILSTQTLHSETMRTLDARQSALEQGRLANRGDIDALKQQVVEWRVERQQFGYNLPQFVEWMNKVNTFIEQVNKGIVVSATSKDTRKQDIAALGGLFSMAVMLGGLVAKVVFG